MNKVTLKYAGNGYRGTDSGNNNSEVICINGQEVAVSEVKATQLLKDYPKNFTLVTDRRHKQEEPTVQAQPKQEESLPPEPTPKPVIEAPKAEPKPKPKPAPKQKTPAKKTAKKR